MSKLNESYYQGYDAKFSKSWEVTEDSKYFFGDPCYAIEDEWQEICYQMEEDEKDGVPCTNGVVEGNLFVALTNTVYGDGEYEGDTGTEYSVDSGTLGIAKVCDDCDEEKLNDFGKVIDVPAGAVIKFKRNEFDEITYEVSDKGGLIFKDTIIMNEADDEADEWEDEDEEDTEVYEESSKVKSSKKKVNENYSQDDYVIVYTDDEEITDKLEDQLADTRIGLDDAVGYILKMSDVKDALENIEGFDDCSFYECPESIVYDEDATQVYSEELDEIYDIYAAAFDSDEAINESKKKVREDVEDTTDEAEIWEAIENILEEYGIYLKSTDGGYYLRNEEGETVDISLEVEDDEINIYLVTDEIEETGAEPICLCYQSFEELTDDILEDVEDALGWNQEEDYEDEE